MYSHTKSHISSHFRAKNPQKLPLTSVGPMFQSLESEKAFQWDILKPGAGKLNYSVVSRQVP